MLKHLIAYFGARSLTCILETRKSLRAILICTSATFLISCADFLPHTALWIDYSRPVTQSFEIDATTAIVYGRFAKESGFASGAELALWLCNQSTKRDYLIRFQDKDNVCGIAVEPGSYKIAGYEAAFRGATKVIRRGNPEAPLFEVRSEACTYLGDFTARARNVGVLMGDTSVGSSTNNSVWITKEFRKKYPNLASVAMVPALDKRQR